MDSVSVYLSPGAVITLGVESHRVRIEILYDLVILIEQTHGHLVGAPTITPAAVPAGYVMHCLVRRRESAYMYIKSTPSYQSSTVTAGCASSCSAV